MPAANTDKKVFLNIAATDGPWGLLAGEYGMTVHAGAWGGGSVALQRQAADGVTWITVQNFTADGFAVVTIPGGTYQLAVVTATGVYADISAVITASA